MFALMHPVLARSRCQSLDSQKSQNASFSTTRSSSMTAREGYGLTQLLLNLLNRGPHGTELIDSTGQKRVVFLPLGRNIKIYNFRFTFSICFNSSAISISATNRVLKFSLCHGTMRSILKHHQNYSQLSSRALPCSYRSAREYHWNIELAAFCLRQDHSLTPSVDF